MSTNLFLNWAAVSVSLFNAILLIWLGLSVLLNAERRVWGIFVASAGLLMGGAFFVGHTAILDRGLLALDLGMMFWWTVVLFPAVILPAAWYGVTLWYSGGFETDSDLFRRHIPGLTLIISLLLGGLVVALFGLVLLVNIFDENPIVVLIRQIVRVDVAGIPIISVGYSIFVLSCILLSLDALRRPGPSLRVMGHQARARARPWLVGASVGLLLVSLIVGATAQFTVINLRILTFYAFYIENTTILSAVDLLTATIISGVILSLGQAVVAYEVFTGKTLPRRSLVRHWRRAVILAATYGLVVGGTVVFDIRLIYSLLLTTMLMTGFFALASYRTYSERHRYLENLRPFVAGPALYDQLLNPDEQSDLIAESTNHPFTVLCTELLGAERAYLIPVGSMVPLVGPPLTYPAGLELSSVTVAELTEQANSSGPAVAAHMLLPTTSPGQAAAAQLSVPLWQEDLLIGLLLLGPRLEGGLYTEESITIARDGSERLLDNLASAEMARRLMDLQRQRLAHSQVVDRRSRRVLHDDVLPYLHTAMLSLSSAEPNESVTEAMNLLTQAHQEISNLLHEMPTGAAPEIGRLGFVEALRRTITEELDSSFDEIVWEISPAGESTATGLSSLTAEVAFYAAREVVRNAAHYGRGQGRSMPFCLRVGINRPDDDLLITLEDNGVGMDMTQHLPGGSGNGLALHSTMMAVVGGRLATESVPNEYTRVTLSLPA